MKLLYLSQYYPPEVGAGSVRSSIMSRRLAEDGWEVDVVCERPNYPTGDVDPQYKNGWVHTEQEHANLWVHRIWSVANKRRNVLEQLLFFTSFMVTSFLYVLTHPKRYDMIYVSSPPIFAAISGYFLSRILGAKFIFEVRDIWPDSAVDEIDEQSPLIKYGKVLEKWLYHKEDHVIPVTDAAEAIIKTRSNGTPTSVIPNGVDVEQFRLMDNPKEGIDEPYDETKFRVGYVGSLGLIHDLETFVAAAKLLEDEEGLEFVIVGDGGRNNRLQEILDFYHPNNVSWVGLKRYEQIPYYISSFDLAVNPVNPSRAFDSIVTVKFYEYLACEVPVVTTGKGLMKEIGEQSGAAITIPPKNPEALADTIRGLMNDRKRLRELASKGRSFVNSQYSRGRLAELLSGRLREIAE